MPLPARAVVGHAYDVHSGFVVAVFRRAAEPHNDFPPRCFQFAVAFFEHLDHPVGVASHYRELILTTDNYVLVQVALGHCFHRGVLIMEKLFQVPAEGNNEVEHFHQDDEADKQQFL